MRKRLIAVLVACILMGLFLIWHNRVHKEAPAAHGNKGKSPDRPSLSASGVGSRTAATINYSPNGRISNAEFNVLRVDLPAPKPLPWRGPFYDSESFQSAENANAAREVLPGWIRKAVLARDSEKAAGYLSSFLSFLKTDNDTHRIETALCLLRLGYKDADVNAILSAGLQSNRNMGNVLTPITGATSERQAILNHLLFFGDNSFDDHIESVFSKLHDKGGDVEGVLELAKYLEAAGRLRTDDFWLGQLESASGLSDAVSALRQRKSVDLVAVLKPKIDADPNSITSRTAAALVYGMTGDPAYEPLLTKLVEEAIQAGSPVAGLELALKELLNGKSPQAETALGRALASENQVLQEIALAALGQVPETRSIQMIKDYATPIIEKDLFPNAAFHALIEIGNQQGDAAYDALKQSVLARDGRSEADFDALEFLKAHRSKLSH